MDDIITKVSYEKRRVQVIVNGEEKLWIPRSAFEEMPLFEDEHVNLDKLKEWLVPRQYHQALSKAISFLAIRARSSLEIYQKLQGAGYLERTIGLVLYKLEKERLIDDEIFARDWVQARRNQQFGKGRIMQELRQKGISQEMAERAMADGDCTDPDEESPAQRLAEKLLRRVQSEPDAEKAMRKVMSAMARRGFSFEESKKAVAGALAQEEDE